LTAISDILKQYGAFEKVFSKKFTVNIKLSDHPTSFDTNCPQKRDLLMTLLNLKQIFIVLDRVRVIMFNATFNNISVRSWRSVLLVEETGVPGENHRPAARH
jgi:hypothetical protein